MRAALLPLLLLAPACALADGLPASPYIQVNGHGELRVAPDMVFVPLTLEKSDKDAALARAEVEDRAAKVIALARKLGLADKDIAAPAVTVYPEYGCAPISPGSPSKGCNRVRVAQHVTRSVTLTLRDLSRYGELVDGLFDIGITDLGGVSFDRSDRDALQEKARALAVADARAKAAGLAQAAGIALGSVYSIAEQGGYGGPRPMAMMAAAKSDAAPEYLSGEIEVGADVTVYYLIGH